MATGIVFLLSFPFADTNCSENLYNLYVLWYF